MKEELLIIFVKNPRLGKAKTRLAATVGNDKALAIYKLLLERTRDESIGLEGDKVVYYSDFVDQDDLWDNSSFLKALQRGEELGEKITHAFQTAFTKGYKRVCIIGSDCYDLTQSRIQNAFESLRQHDVVIGPAQDGGYYLLGMSAFHPKLFTNKRWSTDTVARDTIRDFESGNLRYEILPTLSDVDTEEDLGPWADEVLHATIS